MLFRGGSRPRFTGATLGLGQRLRDTQPGSLPSAPSLGQHLGHVVVVAVDRLAVDEPAQAAPEVEGDAVGVAGGAAEGHAAPPEGLITRVTIAPGG